MRKIVGLMMCVVLMCSIVFVGCGDREESTDNKRTVRICQSGVYVGATSIIMEKKGILEKHLPENVNVEWSQIATGPDIRDAILSGSVDIADFSLMTFITGYENGLPIDLLSFSGSTPIYLYANSNDIEEIDDFNEKSSISITNKNTNLHLAVLALCKRELGNAVALDNNLTAIPAADAIASVQTSSDFDGAVFSFPMSVKADEIENLKQMYDMSDLIKEYSIGSVIVASRDFCKTNADITKAFLGAQEETIEYISKNKEETAEILSNAFGCEKEDVLYALEVMPPTNKVEGYDKMAQLLYEAGILEREPAKFNTLENYDDIVK